MTHAARRAIAILTLAADALERPVTFPRKHLAAKCREVAEELAAEVTLVPPPGTPLEDGSC